MKIIGILILLVGLLISVGGIVGAVVNFRTMDDPWGACSRADQNMRDAHVKVNEWEAARGTANEDAAKKKADEYLSAQRIAEKGCAELKDQYRNYGIASVIAVVVGAVLAIFGALLSLKGIRRGKAVTA